MREDDLEMLIARQGLGVAYCIELADNGLRRCNKALESLQPKQPGRITLLEEERPQTRRTSVNRVRWRFVRWRIRRQFSDGTVQWQAERLPVKGAGRRVSTHMGFRDTAPEVRQIIAAAGRLIEWRAKLMQTCAAFVGGAEGQNISGVPAVAKLLTGVTHAVTRGHARAAEKQAQVAEIVARQEARERAQDGDRGGACAARD